MENGKDEHQIVKNYPNRKMTFESHRNMMINRDVIDGGVMNLRHGNLKIPFFIFLTNHHRNLFSFHFG